MPRKHKILVVDDETEIRELVRDFLSPTYDVALAGDGWEAIRIAKEVQPSLIVLDMLMPRLDGVTTCEYLRKGPTTGSIPIIMLTAVKDAPDRIKAFSSGADDYLTKPFHPDELLARIESKIRRIEEAAGKGKKSTKKNTATQNRVTCGNLAIDMDSKEVLLKGRAIRLAGLDFALLQFFIENTGKLKSREDIIKAVWNSEKVPHRLLDPHIVSLRKSLKGFNHEIATVWGGGYILKKS